MFLVIIGEYQFIDIVAYDAIIKGIDNQLRYKSVLEDKGQLFSFR